METLTPLGVGSEYSCRRSGCRAGQRRVIGKEERSLMGPLVARRPVCRVRKDAAERRRSPLVDRERFPFTLIEWIPLAGEHPTAGSSRPASPPAVNFGDPAMLKTILTACAVSAALLASNVALAQTSAPGEDKAPTAKPATKAEKDAAKKHRQATSKEIAHGKGSLDSDNTVKTTNKPKATSEEKAAAKS